jgi:hypothetical protein
MRTMEKILHANISDFSLLCQGKVIRAWSDPDLVLKDFFITVYTELQSCALTTSKMSVSITIRKTIHAWLGVVRRF